MPLGRSNCSGPLPGPPTLRRRSPVSASYTTRLWLDLAVAISQVCPSSVDQTASESSSSAAFAVEIQASGITASTAVVALGAFGAELAGGGRVEQAASNERQKQPINEFILICQVCVTPGGACERTQGDVVEASAVWERRLAASSCLSHFRACLEQAQAKSSRRDAAPTTGLPALGPGMPWNKIHRFIRIKRLTCRKGAGKLAPPSRPAEGQAQ